MSKYFSLFRGTRQECPLSPLLFDVAIEPLAVSLRCDSTLTGISKGGKILKLSSYADDILLFLSDPRNSILSALKTITDFGLISGYKINMAKSLIFPVNNKTSQTYLETYPFKLTKDKFIYLGVSLTHYRDLFKQFQTSPNTGKTWNFLCQWLYA